MTWLLLFLVVLHPGHPNPGFGDQALAPAPLFSPGKGRATIFPLLLGDLRTLALAMMGPGVSAPALLRAPAFSFDRPEPVPVSDLSSEWPVTFFGPWTPEQQSMVWAAATILKYRYPQEWEFVKTYIHDLYIADKLFIKPYAAVFLNKAKQKDFTEPGYLIETLYHEAWHSYANLRPSPDYWIPRSESRLGPSERREAREFLIELDCAVPSVRLGAHYLQNEARSDRLRDRLLSILNFTSSRLLPLETTYLAELTATGRARLEVIRRELEMTLDLIDPSGLGRLSLGSLSDLVTVLRSNPHELGTAG